MVGGKTSRSIHCRDTPLGLGALVAAPADNHSSRYRVIATISHSPVGDRVRYGHAYGTFLAMRFSRFSKYNARGATLNGFYFQSIGELHRYEELLLAQKAGAITKLKVHPRYPLEVNNVLIATYVADFDYLEEGVLVTEDFKGYETEVFKLKKKLWEAIYGRQLRITRGK